MRSHIAIVLCTSVNIFYLVFFLNSKKCNRFWVYSFKVFCPFVYPVHSLGLIHVGKTCIALHINSPFFSDSVAIAQHISSNEHFCWHKLSFAHFWLDWLWSWKTFERADYLQGYLGLILFFLLCIIRLMFSLMRLALTEQNIK